MNFRDELVEAKKDLKHLSQMAGVIGYSVEDDEDGTYNVYNANGSQINNGTYKELKQFLSSDKHKDTMSKRKLSEARAKVTVFDVGEDESLDRYTVVIDDGNEKYFYGMSSNGLGYNQYIGSESDGYEMGSHLGKRLSKIPNELKSAIKARQAE